MCVGGEEDVRYGSIKGLGQALRIFNPYRGAYCSMVMISLLALPLELPLQALSRLSGLKLFSDGLAEYLSRCAYHTIFCLAPRLTWKLGQTFEGGISGAPQTEAHGAYAFCALACLCILGPPQEMIPE